MERPSSSFRSVRRSSSAICLCRSVSSALTLQIPRLCTRIRAPLERLRHCATARTVTRPRCGPFSGVVSWKIRIVAAIPVNLRLFTVALSVSFTLLVDARLNRRALYLWPHRAQVTLVPAAGTSR